MLTKKGRRKLQLATAGTPTSSFPVYVLKCQRRLYILYITSLEATPK